MKINYEYLQHINRRTNTKNHSNLKPHMDRVKRIWYLSPMRAAKVQANLRIRAVSPEPSLLAHISSELRGTFRQKARSLAPLNGLACAVKICHDGMLEDTNSLDGGGGGGGLILRYTQENAILKTYMYIRLHILNTGHLYFMVRS